jgi:putative nucleotidyltransferase with HDIG domain
MDARTTTGPASAATIERVVEALDRLPCQPLIAMQTIRLIADPDASAAQLGRLVEVDPSLSARVMRLANSPYYGLSNRVASPGRAVVLLGFETVQSVALAASCGILDDDSLDDDEFWLHSLAVAGAATSLAGRARVPVAEAFNAGLLHDLGRSLLDRLEPEGAAEVERRIAAGQPRMVAEAGVFGATHAELGAAALERWRFPAPLVRAVGSHHGSDDRRTDSLSRLVAAAEAVAAEVEPGLGDAEEGAETALAALGVAPEEVRSVVDQAARGIDGLVGHVTGEGS